MTTTARIQISSKDSPPRPDPAGGRQPGTVFCMATTLEDAAEKEAILAAGTPGFFTIPHFNGFNGYLIQLLAAELTDLEEAIRDAWLSQAPPALAAEYLKSRS